jgi:hypothetical protein
VVVTGPTTRARGSRGTPRTGGPCLFIDASAAEVAWVASIIDPQRPLFGQGERLALTHRATRRELFARGALRAARFVAGKPAGRYAMVDVIRGSKQMGSALPS